MAQRIATRTLQVMFNHQNNNNYYLGIANTNSKFRFSIQKLHHCIRESVLSTMQNFFYEYT